MAALRNKIWDRKLLKRILESPEFLAAPVQAKILNFLWDCAELRPTQEVTAEEIRAKCFPVHSTENDARVAVSRTRRRLADYFDRRSTERTRVGVSKDDYRIQFEDNKPQWIKTGSVLDAIWKPFLSPHLPVRLVIGDVDLWDMKPKLHWARGRQDTEVRGRLCAQRGETLPYLPTGLIRAAMSFSRFFTTLKVALEYDISLKAPGPFGSTIVIGNDPFLDDYRTWPTSVVSDFANQHAGSIGEGYFDQLWGRDFTCYAAVERVPIIGHPELSKISIKAFHSIAVEAAAEFLTSERSVREIVSSLKVGTTSLPKYLGFLLKVNCQVTDQAALKLAPGVPRLYLKLRSVELRRLTDQPLELKVARGPLSADETQQQRIEDMMMGAEQGEWIDDIGEEGQPIEEDEY